MTTKQIVRSIKNVTNGYSRPEIKVRNATSNDPWGPSGSDMEEIAQFTLNSDTLFDVMDMLDKRLNDKGKNWRHVMKALLVLDYCLHVGSEEVVRWSKDNIYIVKTLREFQYIDEENKDQGMSVRTKAKEITALLQDDERIRSERANRHLMRDRLLRSGYDAFRGENEHIPGRRRAATLPQRSSFDVEEDIETLRVSHESRANAKREEQADRRARARASSAADAARGAQWRKQQQEKELQREYLDKKNSELLFGAVRTDPQPQTQQPTAQPTGTATIQQAPVTGYLAMPVQSAQPTGYQQVAYQQAQTTGALAFANATGQQRMPHQYPQLTGPLQYQHRVQPLTPQYTAEQPLQTYTTSHILAQPTSPLFPHNTAQAQMPQTTRYQLFVQPHQQPVQQQQPQQQQPLVAYIG
ncbi:uncharacterized protein V1513DRAFT_445293 [Lipomyces chichibuensis]|uniref:uncharacterized protein n=1 Tax=Lipomyces chichibuensis TaxID=1546026 RepID=UPI0033435559